MMQKVSSMSWLLLLPFQVATSQSTTAQWTFVVEQRYGRSTGHQARQPQTIAVDGAGRLVVADSDRPR
jgi:hypothetical protein